MCRINGLTHINLTKLDCLDALETIKLGVEYHIDGKPLPSIPADLSTLEAVDVVYEDIPGWQTDISKCRSWDELPANAKSYIARIEELVGVKCKWIGVGPGRDAIVVQPWGCTSWTLYSYAELYSWQLQWKWWRCNGNAAMAMASLAREYSYLICLATNLLLSFSIMTQQ